MRTEKIAVKYDSMNLIVHLWCCCPCCHNYYYDWELELEVIIIQYSTIYFTISWSKLHTPVGPRSQNVFTIPSTFFIWFDENQAHLYISLASEFSGIFVCISLLKCHNISFFLSTFIRKLINVNKMKLWI